MAVKTITVELFGDKSRGRITVESDCPQFPNQIEELQSATTRAFVLTEAIRAGIRGVPGISRVAESPFPVNTAGTPLDELRDEEGNQLPFNHPDMQPIAYRATYEVTARQ